MNTPSMSSVAREWAVALTRIPSINGSSDEARFADHFVELLKSRHVFAAAGAEITTIPVDRDPLGRKVVAVLVRGLGNDTVVLTGHYDTVGINDYGDLKSLALEPELLRSALIERLRTTAHSASEKRALADLETGGFLPGRGLLDMKAGLAAGLAVVEGFASQPKRAGNLLFLAVPDEEATSCGARQVAGSLADFSSQRGLVPNAIINLDSAADDGAGHVGRTVALGSIGKLLLTAYVVGLPAHACYPFAGINAGALAGAIAADVEWSNALADPGRGIPGLPPTLLSIKDCKQHYDVTTPASVWGTWNALTYGRRPDDLLAAFAQVCRCAVTQAVAKLSTCNEFNLALEVSDVPVLDFATLYRSVLATDANTQIEYEGFAESIAERGVSLPEQCRQLTEAIWLRSGRSGPAVVVGYGSLPYLPVSLSTAPQAQKLRNAVDAACRRVSQTADSTVTQIAFFQGISDVSFLGEADMTVIPDIAVNTPVWGHAIRWPKFSAVAGVPTINAGPWGRDYHTPLERLHEEYAFHVLPRLLQAIIDEVF